MTSQLHAALWLDHHEAKIFHVDREGSDEREIRAPEHHMHRHPRGPGEPQEHPEDMERFFKQVAQALADAEELLIVGPSTAKLQFFRYIREHDRGLESKVVGIETVDHPTDAQLVAHVKQYFRVSPPRAKGP
jgi:stalled ribosome rescue protein Dom34